MKINGYRSLLLLLVVPVLLLVQLGIGIGIYRSARKAVTIERNNNRLDLYLRTNSKYVSYAESATREYQLTDDIKYYESYLIDLDEWKKNEATYDTMPAEIKRADVQVIQDLSHQKLAVTAGIISLYKNNAKDSALNLGKSAYVHTLMDSVRGKTTTLRNRLTDETATARAYVFKLIYAFVVVIVSLIVISLFFAWFIYRTFNQYTRNLEQTVTSLEAANKKMSELNDGLRAANNYLEQLAHISAHDLKSPILTLNGLVDMLFKSGHASDADKEVMRLQKKAIAQMQQTNNGLNDILKLREGLLSKETISTEPMALADILNAVKNTLQQDIEKSGARLVIQLNGLDKVPFPFLYMQSMLFNLMSNAIKFRSPERPLVINLQVQQQDKDLFIFTLQDNGLGFDMARNKGKLFGMFKRFHPQIEGTGVGLHIVKSIAEAFSGRVEVESEQGKGTIFTITIKNPSVS